MKLLLDTQVWLWMQVDPDRIQSDVRAQIADPHSDVLLSAASGWEIAIKYALGRLPLPEEPASYVPSRMSRSGTQGLPVQHAHALAVATLPRLHRDPFDRFGISVAAAGDVNGDGIDDVIIGAELAAPDGNSATGSSYVLFGRRTGFDPVVALPGLDAAIGFRMDGAAPGGTAGFSVSAAGDVNSDGVDDLIIGARAADPEGKNQAGSIYVLFGVGLGDVVFADEFESAP